jgi:sec-independent protein translocase protein TatA
MAGLSIWHILLFAVVLILLFGTAKLKNLGKDLGGAVKDFKDSVKTDDEEARAKIEQERVIDGKASESKNEQPSNKV